MLRNKLGQLPDISRQIMTGPQNYPENRQKIDYSKLNNSRFITLGFVTDNNSPYDIPSDPGREYFLIQNKNYLYTIYVAFGIAIPAGSNAISFIEIDPRGSYEIIGQAPNNQISILGEPGSSDVICVVVMGSK